MESKTATPAYVVYDGACPFCDSYVRRLRLTSAVGRLELVNARSDHPVAKRVVAAGHELDDAIALVIGDSMATGAECMMMLAVMSTPVGLFNKVNAWLFSSYRAARFMYPILRFGRTLTLHVLRRKPISSSSHP